jgi:hypothetical protein
MAEVTPGRARAAKEILLFEDFEAITHHAKLGLSPKADIKRSAAAAHSGHAGLEFFTPAAAGAHARAIWTTKSSKHPLLGLSFWCKTPFSIPAGSCEAFITIQKAESTHQLGIRYNFNTQSWEFFNELKAWEPLSPVTSQIGSDIWTHITIEVNTNTGRVTAVHVNEESFRINRAYAKEALPNSVTYMNVSISVNGSEALAITLYIDDLILQEL